MKETGWFLYGRPLTREDIPEVLRLGRVFSRSCHYNYRKYKGACVFNVNGVLKTWKREPGRFSIPLRYGMMKHAEYDNLTEDNLDKYTLDYWEGGNVSPIFSMSDEEKEQDRVRREFLSLMSDIRPREPDLWKLVKGGPELILSKKRN